MIKSIPTSENIKRLESFTLAKTRPLSPSSPIKHQSHVRDYWEFEKVETPLGIRVWVENNSDLSVFLPNIHKDYPHRSNTTIEYKEEDARILWDWLVGEGYHRQ